MRRRKYRRFTKRDLMRLREATVNAARGVIDANEYRDHPALFLRIVRLSFGLELLAEVDPRFDDFLDKYAALVCGAPDCKKIFIRKAHSHAQRYHSKSCRSRHNMQKLRGVIIEEA